MGWLTTDFWDSSRLFAPRRSDETPPHCPSPATPWTPRPSQTPPDGDWLVWLLLAGRGFGKSRAGAEWVRQRVKTTPLVNLIAPTVADLRDVMVDGPAGFLAICGDDRPHYEPSKRRLSWPNGARSLLFSADEPERLRGPQHMALWCDELGAWRYPEAFTQAMFGLRLGPRPQCVVTTTPRPTPLLLALRERPTTVTTTGSSYDNAANLSPDFFATVIAPYEGTRLGEQEIHGRILSDNPAALWKHHHIRGVAQAPDCVRVVVGVDPGGLADDATMADATGIVVAGLGADGNAYVLADRTVAGMANTPDTWAEVVVNTYDDFSAGRIVAEVNQGGKLVEAVLRTKHRAAAYKGVHAAQGKYARAEPCAALYEQGRVFHVGRFPELEQELLTWTPNSGRRSPNRLDALVYALTELLVVPGKRRLHAY